MALAPFLRGARLEPSPSRAPSLATLQRCECFRGISQLLYDKEGEIDLGPPFGREKVQLQRPDAQQALAAAGGYAVMLRRWGGRAAGRPGEGVVGRRRREGWVWVCAAKLLRWATTAAVRLIHSRPLLRQGPAARLPTQGQGGGNACAGHDERCHQRSGER